MTVRPAILTDLPDLRHLIEGFFADETTPTATYTPADVERLLLAMAHTIAGGAEGLLVAEDSGRVVGFIVASVQDRPFGQPPQTLVCEHLYVAPGAREQGVGTALWHGILALVHTWPDDAIARLTSRIDNTAIWDHYGWQPTLVTYDLPIATLRKTAAIPHPTSNGALHDDGVTHGR